MPRTVQTILEDDKDKAELGVDTEESLVDAGTDVDAVPTPEETAADLKKQLAEANARAERESAARKEAENRASVASTTAGTAVQSQIATQEVAIEGKIGAAKTNLDAIKQQLKQAKSAGDGDAEVELSDALTNARYELNSAEWEKKNFAAWKEQQTKVQPTNENKSPYTAKEQAWIDSHPEFGTNKKFARLAKIAAAEALDEGHPQDTLGYFKYIESTLQEGGLLGTADEPLSGAGHNTASASTAAAPNRTGNGAASVVNKNSKYPYVPNGFRIPADWVQASQDQGFDDPREYANERLKIDAEEKGRA